MRVESKEQVMTLTGADRESTLIALHHSEDRTIVRLGITRAEIASWLDDIGVTPPPLETVGAPTLAQRKEFALAEVRKEANAHIEATWPLWRQINTESGVYPAEEKTQKDKDVVATIEESNRVEDAIDAATTIQQVQDVLDSINFPTFPVA